MGRVAPIYSDRVRYKVSHNPSGTRTVIEPVGWRNDDNEFVRDKSFHGIFVEMTNSLTFYEAGASFLEDIYQSYGINADVIMIKEERNPFTDIWETTYSGFLDLTTYEKKDNSISLKFVSSGLLRLIKARQNEKIEIDRLNTFKGLEIPYLEPKEVIFRGREIFLESLLETVEEDRISDGFSMRFQTQNPRTASMGVPLSETYASDVKVVLVSKDLSYSSTPDIGEADTMFYIDNDRKKDLKININCSFDIVEPEPIDISDITDAFLYLALVVYENGIDYNVKERILLSENIISDNGLLLNNVQATYSNPKFTLLQGESLSLQWYGGASSWGTFIGIVPISFGYLRPMFKNIVTSIKIEENSFFEGTKSNIHLPFEIAERFLKIITEQDNILVSNVLGRTDLNYSKDGLASLTGLTHGFWIRGFSKDDPVEINQENRYKSLTTTFKDFYESYFDVWNLGAGIELQGFKEVFRIENQEYFYNKNILIRLGKEVNGVFEYIQVSNVKRTLNKEDFNSGIEVGYNSGGDYEEAVGLDEYNTKTTFTTIIDKIESIYTKLSKYRADSYGIEFARRKQYSISPTEDTKYDLSNWFVDMKRGENEVFEQRLWQDDFSEAPTGVFSPNTAQNLRLSPVNILLRHGWRIGSGLVKYPLDFIRYGSSVANSGLKTTLDPSKYPVYGGKTYSENGNIQNSELEQSRFNGEIIEFDYEVDYALLQKVRGKTVILGEEIPNFYGLVSFKNEYGKIEEGYLERLSPNGVGQWKLKKFNKK